MVGFFFLFSFFFPRPSLLFKIILSNSTTEWEDHIKAEIQKNFIHSLDFLTPEQEKLGLKAYVLSLKCHGLHFIFKRVVKMRLVRQKKRKRERVCVGKKKRKRKR